MELKNKINNWWMPVIVGLGLIGVSIFFMSQPVGAFLGLTVVFGWLIFMTGVFNTAFAINNRHFTNGWIWYLMMGVFEILIGTALLFQPKLSADSLILFTGFWLMFTAFSKINLAFLLKRMEVSSWWINIVVAILTLFFAFFILINPVFGMLSVVYLVSIPMLFIGIFAITIGIQLKQINNKF